MKKMLFVGDGWLGSNARSLANGFQQVGVDVIAVDTTRVSRPARYTMNWAYLKAGGRRYWRDVDAIHRRIDEVVAAEHPDILFCFKTIHLDQQRLLALDIPTKVHYSADDVSNPVNITDEYLAHESLWDLIVTTKRHNVEEIRVRTSREPLFVWSAFDPAWHHPFPRTSDVRGAVSFIGNMRPDRVPVMLNLSRDYGEGLRLCGPGWGRVSDLRSTGATIRAGAYGEEFSREVARASAHLVLLNSDNRDTHTCRSFEVPAAGGLFVGERTSEHEELIEHGVTGFLFSNTAELVDVLEFVRRKPERGAEIARRGYERITAQGNDYAARARTVLHRLDSGAV